MLDYLYRPEVVRVALVVGVIVSVLFYERVQLTTGGAVVPAYLALSLPAPLHVASTLLAGFGTYFIVHRIIGRRLIVYGRRKFELEVLVGLGLVAVFAGLASALDGLDTQFSGLAAVGFLVPGVLAHDMGRQRPGRTVFAVLVTTGIIAAIVFLYSSLLSISPARVPEGPQPATLTGYPPQLILPAAAASVLIGMLVFARTGLRSGGFISATYLALIAPRWADLVYAGAAAGVTWLLVVKIIMPKLLVFGRRKLSTMILVGAIVSWSLEVIVVRVTDESYVPWRGITVMALIVPALIANDAQRQGWERTLWGTTLTTVGVYASMHLVAAAARTLGWL